MCVCVCVCFAVSTVNYNGASKLLGSCIRTRSLHRQVVVKLMVVCV